MRRRLARLLAAWARWADTLARRLGAADLGPGPRPETRGHVVEPPPTGGVTDGIDETGAGGPPEHWLRLVRAHAPQLLIRAHPATETGELVGASAAAGEAPDRLGRGARLRCDSRPGASNDVAPAAGAPALSAPGARKEPVGARPSVGAPPPARRTFSSQESPAHRRAPPDRRTVSSAAPRLREAPRGADRRRIGPAAPGESSRAEVDSPRPPPLPAGPPQALAACGSGRASHQPTAPALGVPARQPVRPSRPDVPVPVRAVDPARPAGTPGPPSRTAVTPGADTPARKSETARRAPGNAPAATAHPSLAAGAAPESGPPWPATPAAGTPAQCPARIPEGLPAARVLKGSHEPGPQWPTHPTRPAANGATTTLTAPSAQTRSAAAGPNPGARSLPAGPPTEGGRRVATRTPPAPARSGQSGLDAAAPSARARGGAGTRPGGVGPDYPRVFAGAPTPMQGSPSATPGAFASFAAHPALNRRGPADDARVPLSARGRRPMLPEERADPAVSRGQSRWPTLRPERTEGAEGPGMGRWPTLPEQPDRRGVPRPWEHLEERAARLDAEQRGEPWSA